MILLGEYVHSNGKSEWDNFEFEAVPVSDYIMFALCNRYGNNFACFDNIRVEHSTLDGVYAEVYRGLNSLGDAVNNTHTVLNEKADRQYGELNTRLKTIEDFSRFNILKEYSSSNYPSINSAGTDSVSVPGLSQYNVFSFDLLVSMKTDSSTISVNCEATAIRLPYNNALGVTIVCGNKYLEGATFKMYVDGDTITGSHSLNDYIDGIQLIRIVGML